jgi:cytoskeleton protein RodZ
MRPGAGEALRRAREAKGWTVADLAARLKLPERYVTALEEGNAAVLPEPTFVRGYLRACAAQLGIPASELVDDQPAPTAAPRLQVAIEPVPAGRSARRPAGPNFRRRGFRLQRTHYLAAGALLVVLLVWAGVASRNDGLRPAPVSAVPVVPETRVVMEGAMPTELPVALPVPPADTPPATDAGALAQTTATAATTTVAAPAATGAPATANSAAAANAPEARPVPSEGLFLRFRGESWIEVKDVANQVVHSGTGMPGDEMTVTGQPPLTITLGVSSVVDLWWQGEQQNVTRFTRGGVGRVIVGQQAR